MSGWLHQEEPALASPGEIDRYYYMLNETDTFDTNLAASVTISGLTGWHEVCIYFDDDCNNSIEKTVCSNGYGTIGVSTGDVDDVGSDDSGCVDVELYGDWSCATYTIQMSWD